MGKPKGSPKTGGRKKGTPNKTTALLKDAILIAARRAGGAEDDKDDEGLISYLSTQAKDNPTGFMPLLGKVLPMQVSGSGDDGELVVKITREIVK